MELDRLVRRRGGLEPAVGELAQRGITAATDAQSVARGFARAQLARQPELRDLLDQLGNRLARVERGDNRLTPRVPPRPELLNAHKTPVPECSPGLDLARDVHLPSRACPDRCPPDPGRHG